MGILLSFGGVIHSTYPWLQDCSLGHVIWATGCRDMINLLLNICAVGSKWYEFKLEYFSLQDKSVSRCKNGNIYYMGNYIILFVHIYGEYALP